MPVDPTDSLASARSLLERHPAHVIFKHSPFCGRSVAAAEQLQRYQARPDALPVTVVHVFDDRPLSNALETVTGIQHESPQALVVRGGIVQWHASHRRVTEEALAAAVRDLTADPAGEPRRPA